MRHTTRRSWMATTAIGSVAVLVLAACAGWGGPRVVSLSQADLQRQLDRNFPVERRLLEVFDVSLTAPRVQLLAEQNRLSVRVDIHSRDRLLGGRWQGVLVFDTALRWEPADQSVHLTQLRVQDFSLQNAGTAARGGAERLGAALIERVLDEMPLYKLTPERAAELQRHGVAPGAVTVTSRGVEITLAPLR